MCDVGELLGYLRLDSGKFLRDHFARVVVELGGDARGVPSRRVEVEDLLEFAGGRAGGVACHAHGGWLRGKVCADGEGEDAQEGALVLAHEHHEPER